jgi:hypothetical protein
VTPSGVLRVQLFGQNDSTYRRSLIRHDRPRHIIPPPELRTTGVAASGVGQLLGANKPDRSRSA